MINYVLTTTPGLESIAKKEVTRLGYKLGEVQDRMINFEGPLEAMASVNLWSRVGNKLYINLAEVDNVADFDTLFDSVFPIKWSDYIPEGSPILIKAKSIKSQLGSTPSIQKICKKAVIDSLTGRSGEFLREDDSVERTEIMILLMEDKLRILLNTSGDALHKRGYRTEAGEAPIKESLAAGLILLSGWKFKENFYDVFCGSGTIPIEAIMIAKNIAPGINRNFAFENFPISPEGMLDKEKKIARTKVYDGEYKIIASDIDAEAIQIARDNAQRAGVLDNIDIRYRDFNDYKSEELSGCLVSNPPYGVRLQPEDLNDIYKGIDEIFTKNKGLSGGIITSYEGFTSNNYKNRKLYNGGDLAYFYKKK